MGNSLQYGLSVLYKYTNQCNLSCTYCYADICKERMGNVSLEELRRIYEWLAEYCTLTGRKEFLWTFHGGEPLLCGLETLREALKLQDEIFAPAGIRVLNTMQTNLTLITEEYIPLLKQYFGGAIGVSLDYHSGARLYPDGRDSMDDVTEKVRLLRKNGIQCSVISLLNRNNIGRLEEIYRFFQELECNFSLCRVFPAEEKENETGADYLTDDEYADAMIRLFDIWYNDPAPSIRIKNLEEFSVNLLTGIPVMCCDVPNCLKSYLCIGPKGEIFPCTRFGGEEHLLGNVFTDTPKQFLENNKAASLFKKYPLPEECRACGYLKICNGGCLHERTLKGRSFMCASVKRILGHIEAVLKENGMELYGAKRGAAASGVTYGQFV